ncbi:MAG TPA: hypothetical protein VFD46_10635, partial [Chryseolinea sp.]|nr:hypothetical protein [Chryseolinea sp.]
METENQILTTQQSLDIITKMIRQAHGNVKRNSVYLILWGLVITLANLGMFVLMWVEYPMPYLVWLITIPAWILTIYISYRHGKNAVAISHFDRINAILWYSYGIVIFTIIVFGYKINFQLNPVILLVSAIPAFVSGTIIKFRPLAIGGILLWVFGILCFLVGGPWQYLIGAIAVTSGHLVPGLMLRNNPD